MKKFKITYRCYTYGMYTTDVQDYGVIEAYDEIHAKRLIAEELYLPSSDKYNFFLGCLTAVEVKDSSLCIEELIKHVKERYRYNEAILNCLIDLEEAIKTEGVLV